MRRSWETAQIIAQKSGIETEMENNLVDMDFGDWEGLAADEAQTPFPEPA